MTLPQYRRWLDDRLIEAEPLDRPSELVDPKGVAVEAAKRLGRLGYGSSALSSQAYQVENAQDLAILLPDCLAALPPAEDLPVTQAAMTVDQVAEALGVSKSTVYRLVNEQILPHNRVRGLIRVTQQQLVDYQNQ